MSYKIYLILFIIYLPSVQTAVAQDEQYRVEVLVLRHLNGVSEAEQQKVLRDFSNALDLLAPPVEETEQEQPGSAETESPAEEPESPVPEAIVEPSDEEPESIIEEPQVVLLDTQSETMQRVWQRLARSRAFRPELYFSWQQNEIEPFPLVRVHDHELLFTDHPLPDIPVGPMGAVGAQMGEEPQSGDVPTFTDTTTPPAELFADDSGEPGQPAEVMPESVNYYYRIDGTATLRKTRFLHLDLDIVYREPLFGDDERHDASQTPIPGNDQEQSPSAWLVHSLKQSRQVQTQDLEYFDGPVIAVLALISRVETVSDPGAQAGQTSD